MRRIWAFFTLLFSVVLAVGLIGQPVLESADVSNEFSSGSVIQYGAELREDSGEVRLSDVDVSGEVNERLDTAGIRGADVQVIWPDAEEATDDATIRISFPSQSEDEVASLRRILEGSGDLTVTTKSATKETSMVGTDFFDQTVASVEYDESNAPYVALHVKSADVWNTMWDRAKADSGSSDSDSSSSSDSDSSSSSTSKLYIWRGFDFDTDTYDKAFSDDKNVYDATVADKLLFQVSDSNWDADSLTIKLSKDSTWDVTDSRVPWNGKGDSKSWDITSARAMVSSLNASNYDFDLTYQFTSTAVATLGADVLTYLWVGFLVAFLVLALGLSLKFGVAGVLASVTDAVTVLLTLFIGTLLGFEISTAAFVGLAVTAILGALVSVNYFTRVYSELRKGRSVDKADKEGYHKSYLATVDICLSTLIISLFSFLIGRDLVKVTFGFILIGSVLAFLISNYLTKWLMYWLTTGWTKASARTVFGFTARDAKVAEPLYVASDATAQPAAEEAATSKIVLTKKAKANIGSWSAISCALLAACCLTLGITYATQGTDGMFNFAASYSQTYVLSFNTVGNSYTNSAGEVVDFTDAESFSEYLKEEVIQPALPSFAPSDNEPQGTYKTVDQFIDGTGITVDNLQFNMVDAQNDSGTDNSDFTVIYGIISMEDVSGAKAVTRDNGLAIIEAGIERLSDATVNVSAASNISNSQNFTNTKLKERYASQIQTGNAEPTYRDHADVYLLIGLAALALFISFYAFVRFGVAAGITQLVVSVFGLCLGLAVFALFRLPFTIVCGYGLLGGAILSGLSLYPFYSKNRDLLREQHIYRTASYEKRVEASREAMRLTRPAIVVTAGAAAVFGLVGLGVYGSAVAFGMGVGFAVTVVGSVLCGASLVPVLFPVLRSKLSFKRWSAALAKMREQRANRKKRKVIVADPNESHETIIPGLNDYRNW